jgi:methylthioribose-1-phosphate isomerase
MGRRTVTSVAKLAEQGVGLIRDGMNVLTHCNTGALAASDYGTALGVLFVAPRIGATLYCVRHRNQTVMAGSATHHPGVTTAWHRGRC